MHNPGVITEAIVEVIRQYTADIERAPFADVLVRVQDGRPLIVEITSKHKPKPAKH